MFNELVSILILVNIRKLWFVINNEIGRKCKKDQTFSELLLENGDTVTILNQ